VTHIMCSGKYDTSVVANLLRSATVKAFLKMVSVFQSSEQISSGFFKDHGIECLLFKFYSFVCLYL